MMVSDEEKRWLVVGIAMNKVAAPVIRNYIKQEKDTHYTNNTYCHGLTTPCTMATLTYHHINADPNLKRLKFQNINNNLHNHGNHKNLYDYNINSSVDLAKLFLPDYLAEFSAFDESLDMSAMLRLLGFNNPAPIFLSPNPSISIQTSADDVRENVRNKWGHCNVTEWTEALFNDCFSKLQTLVRSLGLTGGVEKMALDQLSDWQTKGCQLCMGHAVDQNLLSLVQQDVQEFVKKVKKTEAQQTAIQEAMAQQRTEQTEVQNSIAFLEDQQSLTKLQLEEHDEELKAVLEWKEKQVKENEIVLEKLVALEKTLREELLTRLQGVEDDLTDVKAHISETDERVKQLEENVKDDVSEVKAHISETEERVKQLEENVKDDVSEVKAQISETDERVKQLEENVKDDVSEVKAQICETDERMKQLEENVKDDVSEVKAQISETDERMKQLEENVRDDVFDVKAQISETDERVKQLEENVRGGRVKDDIPANSTVESFDVKTCRSKLAEHYKRTAKVPTSVWSKKSPVDIHQIYTRLSWVKEEQTPAGSSQCELNNYTDLFTANKNGVVPKRILVQGQTGIGKSTFVKKLAVDWAELGDEKKEGKDESEDTSSDESEDTSSDEYEDTSSDEYEDTSSDGTSSDEYEDTSSKQHEDASEGNKNKTQNAALKKFELVLVINLKEASKCPSLKDVIRRCHIFPEEETALLEGLLNYVTKNQEKVLLVVDSYDEYHCGSNSEIFEIFRGNKLRNCCVLITTRNSKADDLREFKDVHAEITGFSKKDRKAFMRRMLGGEEEAKELRRHLSKKRLIGLTRVPLLLLFFCTLWKKGKLKSFPETKTKLYLSIVQYVLDYSQGKHSPSRFRKVEDFKEILAEIGKVALECLLKDDHVFEYGQLSATILCDESLIIGLLQVTEYAEDLRPAGMVSFIHKSIQEFLAAWYITYRCVTEGNLGGIEQHARTLEDCEALDNVFQFVCGLSDDGAVKVIQHLASVRISDPTLDLLDFSRFWTKPDLEKETDVPPCDITATHWRFSDLVYSSFQEVCSKAKLFSTCLECSGRTVLVSEQVFGFLQAVDVNELTQIMYSGKCHLQQHSFFRETLSTLCKLMEILNLPDVLPSAAESSKLPTKRNGKRMLPSCCCSFSYILLFRSGQFQFYITSLNLDCDEHARLFTEPPTDSNPSLLKRLCSGQSRLQFLTSLQFYYYPGSLSDQSCLALGAAIRNCKHLNSIEVQHCNDSVCDLLEQVPNPSKCSLEVANCKLTSAGALKLANLLSAFCITTTLDLDMGNYCFPALDALFTRITDKCLKKLTLAKLSLTAEVATALGEVLPQLYSLETFELTGADESILETKEIEVLFGWFNKTLPLTNMSFSGFSVTGCLAPLIKSFRFFPDLKELKIGGYGEEIHMGEHHLCGLLESLQVMPNLKTLSIQSKPLSQEHCCTAEVNTFASITHTGLEKLNLDGISLTPAVAAALGHLLPQMSSLEKLKLTGADGSILETKEIKALFGGFNKELPLTILSFSGFSVAGCLAPLFKSFRFFPDLYVLEFEEFHLDEHHMCGLLESLQSMPSLKTLSVESKPLSQGHSCTVEVNTLASFTNKSLEQLNLNGINLTPAVAAALGQLLPQMLSLQTFLLTGADGSILETKEIEALFEGFNKELPLTILSFSGFSVAGCLAHLFKSFRFFPDLYELEFEEFHLDEHHMCGLLESLQSMPSLKTLSVESKPLSQGHCCTAKVNTSSSITHTSLEQLNLNGISLTSAVAAALGQFLPQMLSLQTFLLTGADGGILETKEIEALFGGFHKELPLTNLSFSGFSVAGCLAPLFKSFRFFPDLKQLELEEFHLDEHHICGLLESLQFMPNLQTLSVEFKPLSQGHSCTVEVTTFASITHTSLEELNLDGISLTPAVAKALGQLLPQMSSLQEFKLTGVDGSVLATKEMEALFGGFNKELPLTSLSFSGFSLSGCLAPLFKSFRFFPDLYVLEFEEFHLDEHHMCGLLKSLQLMRSLKTLSIESKPLSQEHCCTAKVNTLESFTNKSLEQLNLNGINLTPAVAAALGQLLPQMLSLQTFLLTGADGSILTTKEIEAMFSGFNKALPLTNLSFSGFSVSSCLAPLFKSFRFFPDLKQLELEEFHLDENHMCGLLESLQLMPNLKTLSVDSKPLSQEHCCTVEVNTLASITHKSLEVLNLDGISLTSAVAAALGQLLPQMLSLQQLELTGADESILTTKEIEAMFGGFNKALPLKSLCLNGFSVTGCLTPLFKCFRFFPDLKQLGLGGFRGEFQLDEYHLCGLLESLQFMPNLKTLSIKSKPLSQEHSCTMEVNTLASSTPKSLEELYLYGINLTPAVAAVLGQLLPEMLSLQELELTGADGSILETNEMKALFGRCNTTLPLTNLSFSGFNVTGCLATLFQSFRFFPNLRMLKLGGFREKLKMDEHHFFALMGSLQFLPNLKTLSVKSKPPSEEHSCTVEVNSLARITHKSLEELKLDGINLTPAVAAALGQLLPEMSSLQELKLTGADGSILTTKEMKALFGGFNKTLPLTELTFSGFIAWDSLSPLIKSFHFFPDLRELNLEMSDMDEHYQCPLLEKFGLFHDLTALSVRIKYQDSFSFHCYTSELFSVTRDRIDKRLELDVLNMTPGVAAALGRSLPELTSLETLELEADGSILTTKVIEALFGGLNKTLPLTKLTVTGFSVTGCLAPLIKSFRWFPDLRELEIGELNLDERHFFALMGSLQLMPNLKTLSVESRPLSQDHCCIADVNTLASITHKILEKLKLDGINLTPAVAAALSRFVPEMSSLQELELIGADGSILQAEEIRAIFGGFNTALPLTKLFVSGFSVIDCPAPIIKSFRFFPDLRELELERFSLDGNHFFALMEGLKFMPNLKTLSVESKPLSQEHCCTVEVNTSASITHKSLEKLKLDGINMTPAVAAALGQLLPEMSSLETFDLTGADGSILATKEIEALFGGFNNTLPLTKLSFSGFSVTGCLAPLIKSFRFFPDLRELELGGFHMDEKHFFALMDSLQFMPNLKTLSVESKPLSQEHSCAVEVNSLASITPKSLEELKLDGINMTPAVAAALGQLLPEMSSLKELKLTGADGSILETKEMKALFSGFNKALPLTYLSFSGFSRSGCLAPLFKSFRFFPDLGELELGSYGGEICMDETHFFALMESVKFMPNLKTLSVKSKPPRREHCCAEEVKTFASIPHKSLEKLKLGGIRPTLAITTALGQLLPEMSSIQQLELTGANGSILTTKEMEALFGGFYKTLPLTKLTFRCFNAIGCLAPLIKSFRFFPCLRELQLGWYGQEIHMDGNHFSALLESLKCTPNLKTLSVESKPLGHHHCCIAEVNTFASITHENLEEINLDGLSLSQAVATVLGGSFSEMSVQELELNGVYEGISQIEEMKTLFGEFNKIKPLYKLTSSGFSVTGCLAPRTSLCFFPNLRQLKMDEHAQGAPPENFGLLDPSALTNGRKYRDSFSCHNYISELNTLFSVTRDRTDKRLNLSEINLTPELAKALGRSLLELSSLKTSELTGADESILTTKELEALLGGFTEKDIAFDQPYFQ